MTTLVAMLRGVNVGGNHRMPMAQLRTLCEGLRFARPETFIQSGNLVFEAVDPAGAAECLEEAIEREFGFRSSVVIRTAGELRVLLERDPFGGRDGAKSQVTFLACDPGEAVREQVRAIPISPEELWMEGRELLCFYPNGQGKTKVPMVKIERMLGCAATTRNWNTVVKLSEMAEGRAVVSI